MKTVHRGLKLILGVAMLLLLASCETIVTPNDQSVGGMSVEQAREVIVNRLSHGSIAVDWNSPLRKIKRVRVSSDRFSVIDEGGKRSVFIFRKLPQLFLANDTVFDSIKLPSETLFFGSGRATPIINALYVLKQNAIGAEENESSFAASLAGYRNKAASNAALPEEANRYKVQAEGAVRDKQFDAAADFYEEALKIAPWWAVGHFNRALVLGETGDYGMAICEMKRYLQLVPDAPNARAAQDKIYDWERLDSK